MKNQTLFYLNFRLSLLGSIKGKAGKTPISSALLNTPLKFISGRTTKRDLAQFTTNAICPILSLDIGPIDLDLLGMLIDFSLFLEHFYYYFQ